MALELNLGGCSRKAMYHNIRLSYSAGDIVFVLSKANKGILERVSVHRVLLSRRAIDSATAAAHWLSNTRGFCDLYANQYSYLYVDTYNALWHEGELISHSEALSLAIEYWENQLLAIEEVSCDRFSGRQDNGTVNKIKLATKIQAKIDRLNRATALPDPLAQTISVLVENDLSFLVPLPIM